ncbi:hypothetical protein BaRGS_00008685, partial [Batillaria attramentaria]
LRHVFGGRTDGASFEIPVEHRQLLETPACGNKMVETMPSRATRDACQMSETTVPDTA